MTGQELEKGKIDSYYATKSRALEKICHNLMFIVADDAGRITWNDVEMTPYTFVENFLILTGGLSWNGQYEGFIPDEEISKRVADDGYREICDPIKQIEARRKGIIIGAPIGFLELKYQRHKETGLGGYLFYLSDDHLRNLYRLGIKAHIIKR